MPLLSGNLGPREGFCHRSLPATAAGPPSSVRDIATCRTDRSAGRRSLQEIHDAGEAMGTWDVEPFDNDDATDFAGELNDAPAQVRSR
ncbi:DUF4259 domain-containing protein [Actinoplanes regularis]|uniref:DUF4259 domain-containing protein n=1 Tax=Actinoplanes regularis TaxID=52697 RepID=UPI000B79106C